MARSAGTGATAIDGFDPYACGPEQNVCRTSPSSVGPGAVMGWSGAQSRTANVFHLSTSGCPPNTPGIYDYGATQTLTPFGNGFRCIASPVTRTSPVFADGAGVASRHVNLTCTQIDPGETWYFQFWYRNPAGGGAFFNLSYALSVPFCNGTPIRVRPRPPRGAGPGGWMVNPSMPSWNQLREWLVGLDSVAKGGEIAEKRAGKPRGHRVHTSPGGVEPSPTRRRGGKQRGGERADRPA